ncbi:hypothetical protein [Cohnella kolymensis]|nr:hypothetical protein [Cohnella kolymensis]
MAASAAFFICSANVIITERGTHFAAMEAPDLLVPDIQFFRRYR